MKRSRNDSSGDFLEVDVDTSRTKVEGEVRCGRPSWKGDESGPLPLEQILSKYGNHVYWLRVVGRSMEGAGLYPGDYVIVSPSVPPRFGDLVVVRVNDDDPIVKRHTPRGLYSEYADRRVKERFDGQAEIVGVVVFQLGDVYGRVTPPSGAR